jgi:hypothetical protein
VIGNDVYVGYSKGTPKDGTGCPTAVSTIVRYSNTGQILGSTTVVGHNDGLRFDAATNQIWATQNEDANPNLVLITPGTLAKSPVITLNSVNGGGGFDDILFQGGATFLSASNPANNPNTDPAVVKAALMGGSVVTTPVLLGNATATLLNNNTTVPLNLQDPDSLSQTLDGRAVLTSQADGELVFISHPGTAQQSVSVLQLKSPLAGDSVNVDDTAFGGSTAMSLLVADKTTNEVWRVTGPFDPNFGYSAAQTLDAMGNAVDGFIGAFDAGNNTTIGSSNGLLTQIVTGLGNPAGEAFLAGVPEPSTWAMMLVGFAGLGYAGYRRARKASAAIVAA